MLIGTTQNLALATRHDPIVVLRDRDGGGALTNDRDCISYHQHECDFL